MRSAIVGRIGAAISAVALLAAGLVSVAAPAQAQEGDYPKSCGHTAFGSAEDDEPPTPEEAQAVCNAKFGLGMIIWNGYYAKKSNSAGNAQWHIKGNPTEQYCASEGKVQTDDGTSCRDKTADDCAPTEEYVGNGECRYQDAVVPIVDVCDEGFTRGDDGKCAPDSANPIVDVCDEGFVRDDDGQCEEIVDGLDKVVEEADDLGGSTRDGGTAGREPVQQDPPPPPCWSGEAGNNCPVGGALRFAAPEYAMVGVPVTMYAYASWRPDANSPAQPTNGTAVIRVDGEDYSGVEFKDGVAEWRFIPETEGVKDFTASGVVFSGLSGASAYIDTVPARTYVLEYDPAAYATAFKNKAVEIGEKYVITDPNQARSYLEDRYEFRVADKSEDVCAVYETKKGAVKAKFNEAGKCKVIWTDTESGDKGNFTFIAEK
jgi:hypothetical protein